MKIKTMIKKLESLKKDLKCVGRFWGAILPIKEFKIESWHNGINVITTNEKESKNFEKYMRVSDAIIVLKKFNPDLKWETVKQIKTNEEFCCFCFD